MVVKLKNILLALLATVALSSCHDVDEWEDNPRGNFEALWTILDEHYCFFKEKGVDWDVVHDLEFYKLDK
jgi:hypothetical protein